MAALLVKFVNMSYKTDFSRNYYGSVYQIGMSGPGVTPGPILSHQGGSQSYSIDQVLSVLDQGPLEVFCCWRSPDGHRFGVRLHANFQMFGLGYRPNWYVMSDTNPIPNPPDWKDSGNDPANPYTWPTDFPFKITATPDSGHMSLTVTVTINDKN